MKAEDYDAFLADPADWGIRQYLPRVFGELQGLGMLPTIGDMEGCNPSLIEVWADATREYGTY
jgi:hypothetical protein